jgi:pimeloyl-ACP methyl ester carboxylesterase
VLNVVYARSLAECEAGWLIPNAWGSALQGRVQILIYPINFDGGLAVLFMTIEQWAASWKLIYFRSFLPLALLALWIASGSPGAAPAPSESRYIRDQNSDKVIIFVHGLFGDSVNTWTNGSAYWPEMITKDHDFDGVDVFVYQYPTSFGSTFAPDQLADDMRHVLRSRKVLERKQLVFLSYSMGGIVTRAFLLKNSDVSKKTTFLQFFSTPTDGSFVANITTFFINHPQIERLDTVNNYLQDQNSDWVDDAITKNIPAYCAYETQKTFGVQAVTRESATHLCTRHFDAIDANHFNVVKPNDMSSQPYSIFKANFLEAFRQSSTEHEINNGPAIIRNRQGGSIGDITVANNAIVGTQILENAEAAGKTVVSGNNIVTNRTADDNKSSTASERPTISLFGGSAGSVIMANNAIRGFDSIVDPRGGAIGSVLVRNSFIESNEHRELRPFHVVIDDKIYRNMDGGFFCWFLVQMDVEAKLDYMSLAIKGDAVTGFRIMSDERMKAINQIPIAGYLITKVMNPKDKFGVAVYHSKATCDVVPSIAWRYSTASRQ